MARGHNQNGATSKPDALFEREDWTLFRSVRTISQLSGVPPTRLRRVIAKEIVDNAIDASGNCRVGKLRDGGFYVEDDGPGIAGKPKEIARLFSFRRPLMSSKIKRMPARGALGTGLRIAVAAVFASAGRLTVCTRGRKYHLRPEEDGSTTIVDSEPWEGSHGTRIEIQLGDSVPDDCDCLAWARCAIKARGKKPIFAGKTSPWWYDSDAFFEYLQASGDRTVQEVMQHFDGWAGRSSDNPAPICERPASSLKFDEADELLQHARSRCHRVDPRRFNLLKSDLPGSYAKRLDSLTLQPGRGNFSAQLPYTVEVWCQRRSAGDRDVATILVNRTPVTGDVSIARAVKKSGVTIFGCNLGFNFTVGREPVAITVNVQIPYMPITSNGKEPDLAPFIDDIGSAVETAARKCQRANRSGENQSRGILPRLPKGRPSDAQREQYAADLADFADRLKKINSTLEIPVGSRGWCYILEENGLSKGDFDRAQRLINDCRKTGLLPIDFANEDEARSADNLENPDGRSPAEFCADLATTTMEAWQRYTPGSFWDNQPVYIQMVVEKIDLKHLFLPICREYAVPIINSRGWSDLNLRAGLMRRFQEHERKGRRPILLCCNDHDPIGLQIPELLPKHLEELTSAVGWHPGNLTVDRFGLNRDFIDAHNLTWIDGLQTSSGKDLGDPKHPRHYSSFVLQYIAQFGKRKVEANALVVRQDAARQVCRNAIEKYLDMIAVARYRQWLAEERQKARAAMPVAFNHVLTRDR
jgi:hypothetical protein